jgi:hypothetical protein
MTAEPKHLEYVLATKWSDGDPLDQWAIGFYDRRIDDRFFVLDDKGCQMRANGFRRVKKISGERGRWLLNHEKAIEWSERSLWWWVRRKMKDNEH